jgi:hypothetical protein
VFGFRRSRRILPPLEESGEWRYWDMLATIHPTEISNVYSTVSG